MTLIGSGAHGQLRHGAVRFEGGPMTILVESSFVLELVIPACAFTGSYKALATRLRERSQLIGGIGPYARQQARLLVRVRRADRGVG